MSAPVLNNDGRALVFDRVTGEVLVCAVPTAVENVANGAGRFVHGETGDRLEAEAPAPVVADAPIPLVEPDVLPLPAADTPPVASPNDGLTPAQVAALDGDKNGEAGGSLPKEQRKPKRSTDPEREEVKAKLKAAGIKFFGGAPTEDLKKLLPG